MYQRLDSGWRDLIKTHSQTAHFSDTIFQDYDNVQETQLWRYDIHLILQPSATMTVAPHYCIFCFLISEIPGQVSHQSRDK